MKKVTALHRAKGTATGIFFEGVSTGVCVPGTDTQIAIIASDLHALKIVWDALGLSLTDALDESKVTRVAMFAAAKVNEDR